MPYKFSTDLCFWTLIIKIPAKMLSRNSSAFCSVLCFLVFINCSYTKQLPSWVPRCRADDPRINDCMRAAIGEVQKRMLNGIPELQIPSMNPLVLPEVRLNSGPSFKAQFTNISIYQADDFVMETIHLDLSKNHLDVKMTFPMLRILSTYDVDGHILILDIKGKGPADGNYTNVRADAIVDGARYTKNGKEYIRFDTRELNLRMGKTTLHFDRIFGDNEELNEQTNRVINDNIDGIMEELRPVINEAVTQFVFGLVNRIFSKFSIDELFIF